MNYIMLDGKKIEISEETANNLRHIYTTSAWLPNYGEWYWYIPYNWDLEQIKYYGTPVDDKNMMQNNCFRTKQDGEKHIKYLQAMYNVKRYIVNNCAYFKPDWNNIMQDKYTIYYNSASERFSYYIWNHDKSSESIGYLGSVEDVKKVIKDCEEDLKIIFDIEE